VSKTQNFAKS